ncbi:gene transfer agent family protein [Pseudovibrio sp. JE062]|uniref:gene transfer agent family protein n=1 Tax=Pseudovibrio sp. JE062 TaxID=439495 RepID=UPI0002E50322|nr:gene transfer agent family protein [Pseudovibrio sp. JE062]
MPLKTYSRGVNRRRGEILAELGGQKHILVLTLGALAELEDTLNCTSLQQLTERFSEGHLSAADIIKVLGAGLRGGGLIIENEEVAELSHEGGVAALAKLAGELLVATFSPQQPHAPSKPGQS